MNGTNRRHPWTAWIRAAAILAAAGTVGLIFNQTRSLGIPLRAKEAPDPAAETGGGTVSPAEAERLIGTAIFLDARDRLSFEEEHIPGAINLPYEEFETAFGEVASFLSENDPLIVYCQGGDCELSHALAAALRQGGFTDVRVLQDGMEGWIRENLPVERGAFE